MHYKLKYFFHELRCYLHPIHLDVERLYDTRGAQKFPSKGCKDAYEIPMPNVWHGTNLNAMVHSDELFFAKSSTTQLLLTRIKYKSIAANEIIDFHLEFNLVRKHLRCHVALT